MKGAWLVIPGVGLILIGWAAWPRTAPGKGPDTASACATRLRSLYGSLSIYAQDHNDRLPKAADWSEAISDYLGKMDDLRCPSAKAYGYAFHLDLQAARLSSIPHPDSNPVVFDSDDFRKDAADNMQSIPRVPRHINGATGASGNNTLYADGHAAMASTQ